MTLGDKQRIFTGNLGLLIAFIYAQGYQLSLGRGRVNKEANDAVGGHKRSCHLYGLAQDLNLFIDGQYQQSTDSHKLSGEFWEKLHPLNRWGGRFGDGNHYSMEHRGVR